MNSDRMLGSRASWVEDFAIHFGAVPAMQRLFIFADERKRVAENVREARRLGHEMPGPYIQTLNVGAISFRHPVLLWRRHPAVSLFVIPQALLVIYVSVLVAVLMYP